MTGELLKHEHALLPSLATFNDHSARHEDAGADEITLEGLAGAPAQKAAASGLASLNASSKVVQDPANATATVTASKIPIADGSAKLDGWITRYVQEICYDFATSLAVGDGKGYVHIPPAFNGMNLIYVHARVITAGTTNTTDIQIANVTDTVDMLSTKLTIDSTETGSDTAATPAVIDTTKDDVATNDLLRIDIDAISTTAPKGLIVTLGFGTP